MYAVVTKLDIGNSMKTLNLTPSEENNMWKQFDIKVHDFQHLTMPERRKIFQPIKDEWATFKTLCSRGVSEGYLDRLSSALEFDHMVVISWGRYLLGFAMTLVKIVNYDDSVTNLLNQARHRYRFDDTHALHIEILCSREGTGIGVQLIQACQNLAINLRCPTVSLDSVTTAYGFYNHLGYKGWSDVATTCSPQSGDVDKFKKAIENISAKLRQTLAVVSPYTTRRYNAFLKHGKTTANMRVALEAILATRVVSREVVYGWTAEPNELRKELQTIVDNVFTSNGLPVTTIPMSICVITKTLGSGKLLTPDEMKKMREKLTIKALDFDGTNTRKEEFAPIKAQWNDLMNMCQHEVNNSFLQANVLDMDMVFIYLGKHVLGFAFVKRHVTGEDEDTLLRLAEPRNRERFTQKHTSLRIQLVCSRKGTGLEEQLVRFCEKYAIDSKCASVHLEALPKDYFLYKRMGFEPWRDVIKACSLVYINNDADKFGSAIADMVQAVESFRPPKRQKTSATSYNDLVTSLSPRSRVVLTGIMESSLVDNETIVDWAGSKKRKLIEELNNITNNVFSTTHWIPMSKCLLTKPVWTRILAMLGMG